MIKKFLPLLLALAVILALSWRISQNRSLSLHFVDEEDHFVGADYMNRGFKLYTDISSNHQPLVYLASAVVQKITHPQNLFMLVRRNRQAMFVYGAVFSLILVLSFGFSGLITVLFLEFLKYGLFGNLMLMESLAVYPAVYLLLALLAPRPPGKVRLILAGLSSFLVFFNLVPLWPWLALVGLAIFVKVKKQVVWLLAGFIIPTIILFLFISPADWFKEIVYNNWLYAVPALNQIKSSADWVRIIFFPFTAYLLNPSLQVNFIRLFFTTYLIACFFNRKLLWLYPLLILANTRVLSPASAYYEGFHLLPWLGLAIAVFALSFSKLKLHFKLPLALWALVLMLNRDMPYFLKTNPADEYYINYSTFEDFNFAVKQMFWPTDRLAVLSSEPLIHWQAPIDLATKQIVYYAWQHEAPELKAEYDKVFKGDNPPEFIYGNNEAELTTKKYINLLKFDQPTQLYVRRDKFEAITPSTWKALSTRGFSPPQTLP